MSELLKLKKNLLYGFPAVFLIFLWLGIALFKDSKNPFSILTLSALPTESINTNYQEIYKGQTVTGTFRAQEDNLGILAIRFNTFHRISHDRLIFYIKEMGANNWYYTNIYKVDQFQPDAYFTFGFPLITAAKGHVYEFELISTGGKHFDAVAISSISPPFVTRYQMEKSKFLHNKTYTLVYLYKKFIEFFSDPQRFLHSLIFLLPLFLYLLWVERRKKIYTISVLLASGGVFLLCIYILSQNYNQFLELLIALIVFILRARLGWSSKAVLVSSYVLFLLSVATTSIGWEVIGNKLGIFFYYLLCIGIITIVLEKNGTGYLEDTLKKIYKGVAYFPQAQFTRLLIIIGSIFIGLYMFEPILHLFHKEIWLGWGYSDYLVKNLDPLMSPFSAWRDIMGEPTTPRIFDFLYYLPLKVLLLLRIPGEIAWIGYVYVIFLVSFVSCTYFAKKLFPNIGSFAQVLAGLLYTFFIPLNYELGNFSIKIIAAFLPLVLLISYVVLENLRTNLKHKTNIFLWLVIIFFVTNFFLLEPRGFLVSVILITTFSIYYALLYPMKRVISKIFVFFALFFVGVATLCLPILYTQHAIYAGAVNLAAPIQESVYITKSLINYLIFQPSPILYLQNQSYILLTIISLGLYTGIIFIWKDKQSRKIFLFLGILWILYMLFLNNFILQQLVTHIPFGQLFRSWRLSQYIAGFIMALCLLGIWLSKSAMLKILSVVAVIVYFILSITVVNSSFLFVKADDIMPYLQANIFLSHDMDAFKVLWIPEMGDLGTHPFWTPDAAQTFPEFMSSKPTYSHNYNSNNDVYSWLATALRTSELQNNPSTNHLLNILGIKYLILHEDINNYASATAGMKDNISRMQQFPKVFSDNYISIYKNNTFQSRVWVTPQSNAFICYQGLRCLSNYYQHNSVYASTAFLADIVLPKNLPFKSIYNPDMQSRGNIQETLLLNTLIQERSSDVLVANQFFANLEAVGCLTDTHQGGYHLYWQSNESYAYSQNFTQANCFFLLLPNKPDVQIAHAVKRGNYRVVIRYMQQKQPAKFFISLDNTRIDVNAGNKHDNFYTYLSFPLHLTSAKSISIHVHNIEGNNFISLIAFIPEEQMQQFTVQTPITSETQQSSKNSVLLTNIRQKNPATWEMDATLSKPSILNFAESYNPLWKAVVTSASGKREIIYATQGYGMINAFPIYTTGIVHIHLVYEPQEKFFQYIMLAFLGVAVLGFIFYKLQKYLTENEH